MNHNILIKVANGEMDTEEAAEILMIRESEVMMYVLNEGYLSLEAFLGIPNLSSSVVHEKIRL